MGCTRMAGSDYPMDTKFMTVSRRQLVLLQAHERNPSRWIGGNVRQFRMASSQFLNPDRPSRLIGSSPEGHLMEGTRVSGEQAVHWPKAA